MQEIKCILFDFFGTLVNYKSDNNTFKEMYKPLKNFLTSDDICKFDKMWIKEYTLLIEEASRSCNEFSMYEVADKIGESFKCVPQNILYEVVDIFMKLWESEVTLYKDTPIMISKLSKKYKLGIVSNTHYKKLVPNLLKKFQIDKYFDIIILSIDKKRRKPCKSIFLSAVNGLNMNVKNCCFIGDNYKEDIIGADNIGMLSIQILRESYSYKVDKNNAVIRNLYDLEKILES